MSNYIPISLNVTSSATSLPVVGAAIFINGTINFDPTQFTVVTDSNGNASFQIPATLTQMQITATGYQSTSQSISTSSLLPQSIQVVMVPAVVPASAISFQFDPAVAGITWQLTQSSNAIDNSVSTSDGSSPSNIVIPNGTYTVAASFTGYQSISQSLIINGQTSPYTLTLIQNTDPSTAQQGNTNGNSTPLSGPPASVLSSTTTSSPVSSEYVYPTTEFDKYFTIVGVCIYIGNLFIDEVSSIQYALQDNAIPIYGYASRYVDAYGQGRSLVQGQLTINFVTEAYLYTVMKDYAQYVSTSNKAPALSISGATAVDQVLGLMTTRDSYLQQAVNNPNSASTAITTGNSPVALAAAAQTQITALTNAMPPAQITTLNTKRQAQQTGSTSVISFDNAVYQDVLFDIRITMGNEITGVQRTRYIEKCKLISNEQVIAPDGNTLLDSYGFIGRRLR